VPVVRSATLLRYPQLETALRRLAGRISAADMRRMNHEVDGLRRDPREVAQRFVNGL
jgi:glycine betaine/choline ABC-type transport system substrate-binding protein